MKKSVLMLSAMMFLLGEVTAQNLIQEQILKKQVSGIENALHKIIRLEPITFEYNTDDYAYLKLKPGSQYGFRTDHLQTIFPELVTTKHISYPAGKNAANQAKILTIDETRLLPLLVAAVKEQQVEIENLKQVVTDLIEAKNKTDNQTE